MVLSFFFLGDILYPVADAGFHLLRNTLNVALLNNR